jgi:hypothetical protein
MMSHRVSSLLGSIALMVLVAACAGPTTQAGPGGLPGVWHGSFLHPGADYTSPSRADLTLQVNPDSTYTFKWGARAETTGTIAAQGNRVILNDSSGAQITLMRSGDALYGVMKDTSTGRTRRAGVPRSGRLVLTRGLSVSRRPGRGEVAV